MRFNRVLLDTILDSLFPPKCLLCNMTQSKHSLRTFSGSNKNFICTYCQTSLPEINTACSKCCTPLSTDTELCGICIKQERYWQQCISAFAYSSPIPELIHTFKNHDKKDLTEFFTQSIVNTIDDLSITDPAFLLSIPMHPKRFAKRGYNQSDQLARSVSKATGIPYMDAFIKIKETPQQASLDKKAREISLKNNFKIKKDVLAIIKDKHFVLIDDVMTTGATTSELARLLKIAKAERVDVWCIART